MFPILFCVIVFTVWLQYELKSHSRKDEKNTKKFFELESEANSVRKKPIDSLNYITISEKSLPFLEINDENIKQSQEKLLKFRDKKCLNLSSKTNTDLKLEYGVANLTILSEYDENFTELVRLLQSYGKRLHELSYDKEAIEVLQFAVSNGSDLKSTYCLLCDLYLNAKEYEKIDDLIKTASELESLLKPSILTYLNEKKESINH